MLDLKRDEFQRMFGCPPGELFNLKQILTGAHMNEAYEHAKRSSEALVRREYGTLRSTLIHKPLIYAIEVAYWMEDGSYFRASIQRVIVFDNKAEQNAHIQSDLLLSGAKNLN